MNLQHGLKGIKEQVLQQMPREAVDTIMQDLEEQITNGIEETALKVGDKMPEFELKNHLGNSVKSSELLSDGPLIIDFFRGDWCPYCVLELAAYQEILPEIKEVGASVVAISGQIGEISKTLVERHSLEYDILSDLGNKVAKQFGLSFKVPKSIKELYEGFGVDFVNGYGNENYELPFAGTYVVDKDGTVLDCFASYDYSQRMEPADALEAIKKTLNK